MYISSCEKKLNGYVNLKRTVGYQSTIIGEKKLNGYVNLKRTVGYQSTIIGEFACYILACLSSCLITEWLLLPHEATSSCHRISVYCTVSCFAGSVFTSMIGSHESCVSCLLLVFV